MPRTDQNQLSLQIVEWTARQIHDPVWRLRYLQAMAPAAPAAFCKFRKAIGIVTCLAIALAAVPWSVRKPEVVAAAAVTPWPQPLRAAVSPAARPDTPKGAAPVPDVWPVEQSSEYDLYSNGLRIENRFAVGHKPRRFVAYDASDPEGGRGEARTEPVGIVYHTTESLQAPFESSQNNVLKKVGEGLLEYVRRRRCYNFVIDRFGRVFRVVRESDAADHAGHSVWADDRFFYLDLNDSFVGISFEAQTAGTSGAADFTVPGYATSGGAPTADGPGGAAQIRAAAMLTEMLRSRYKIAGRNCVTHAQVSVNPSNMQVGYHVDWASSFPFETLGLPDNYASPSPAISLFGFAYDESFQQRAGPRLSAGALEAYRGLVDQAQARRETLETYRKVLNRRYLRVTGKHRG